MISVPLPHLLSKLLLRIHPRSHLIGLLLLLLIVWNSGPTTKHIIHLHLILQHLVLHLLHHLLLLAHHTHLEVEVDASALVIHIFSLVVVKARSKVIITAALLDAHLLSIAYDVPVCITNRCTLHILDGLALSIYDNIVFSLAIVSCAKAVEEALQRAKTLKFVVIWPADQLLSLLLFVGRAYI